MSEQIQKLEGTVTALKSRLFDANEEIAQSRAVIQNLSAGFQEIIQLVGITGNEEGSVEIKAVVEAVRALIPEQLELDEVKAEAE
ncbi:tail fiber assembly protein [Enterobacter phage vB-EclM_KMB20]|nr:tail fiber assembly protein [Enterobacter phage vB-EclM_KMB20]